jgi:uncharacterized protein YcaQ
MLEVSRSAARALLLNQQGLLAPPARAARKQDVLACIRRMGLLQIDTIHVIARSPYFVLFSRLGAYEPRWLDETHSTGKLFEYWSHAMCWIPAEDWPLWRGLMLHNFREGRTSWGRIMAWLAKHRDAVDAMHAHIRQCGPVRSSDFDNPHDKGGVWWNWKFEKAALEYSFWHGDLLIPRRERFQRVYDLRERVLPAWDDAHAWSAEEAQLELVRRSAQHLGIATEPWLRDYYRLRQTVCQRCIRTLLERGELLEARIMGVRGTAYLPAHLLPLLKRAGAGRLVPARTALLSPFDPVVWDRNRNRELFDFDYTIEVYTPEHKRVFGYFVLPILHRGELVGRLDPKAHRKDGVFEVRALHLEHAVRLDEPAWDALASAILECAAWHGTPAVRLGTSVPSRAARQLRAAMRRMAR